MITHEVPKLVQTAFNRAALSYDDHNHLQSTVAEALITQLKCYRGASNFAVDLGCGTGDSTRLLLNSIHCQQVVAVDIADKLLEQAKKKLQHHGVNVCFGNFNHALFPRETIDLVMANMSLQWSVDLKWTLKRLYSQMKVGGVLAFTLPVLGTFVELKERYRNNFNCYDKVCDLLQQESFSLLDSGQQSYILTFDSPLQALQSIKQVGANCVLHRRYRVGLLGRNRLKRMFQTECGKEEYRLTYAIAFFIVQRS